ncbi:MAG TPA: CotH kinase family protein [Pirellulales bacterium]|jgi:hypothetical protein
MGPPNQLGVLLASAEVQQELQLTSAQKKQVEKVLADQTKEMQAGFQRFNPAEMRDLDPADREKRFEQMQERMTKAAEATRSKIDKLLQPAQAKRLDQLLRQRESFAALLRPEAAKELGLSQEQQQKLQDLQDDRPPFLLSDEDRKQQESSAMAVLSEQQRPEWTRLMGAEFKFPESVLRPSFPGGPGGPGGPMQRERQLIKQFDKNGDGKLNRKERDAAREWMKKHPTGRSPGPGLGPPPGGPAGNDGGARPGARPAPEPGKHVSPGDVANVDAPLYSLTSPLRTLFLDFADADWEAEMADFYKTDVEVPATLTVDGRVYENIGVHFRGLSSFFAVPEGRKRSLNVSLDFGDSKQRLYGYKTLNLLNCHEDPSCMHTVLYFYIAQHYMPAPKANYVNVVINGENWGLYANVEQFDKTFVEENFAGKPGTRWKVPGSPGGRGGLAYLGEDVAAYKGIYQIKSDDKDDAWQALIRLCKTLCETPLEYLEAELAPQLDIDEALWFLALENVLINSDGYWIRASDYSLYLDKGGLFHVLPHDANETFQPGMGPGFGRRNANARRADPLELDPLVGLKDRSKPLRSRLLAVPSLQQRYLQHVRAIAEDFLDWDELRPVVESLAASIRPSIAEGTRQLYSLQEFDFAVSSENIPPPSDGRHSTVSLRNFIQKRHDYLMNLPAVVALDTANVR